MPLSIVRKCIRSPEENLSKFIHSANALTSLVLISDLALYFDYS